MTDQNSIGTSIEPENSGMSPKFAKRLEYGIVILCLVALAFIFQPFSKMIYAIGAGTIIIAGLLFNVVPFCVAGKPFKGVIRAGLIVFAVFVVVFFLAISSAKLYGIYIAP
jgi:hypothetical protein